MYTIKIALDDLENLARQFPKMKPKIEGVLVSAVNRTMEMAYTQVKRSLSRQVGISQNKIESGSRGLRLARASRGHLKASIVARSDWTPLGYFNPTQFKRGVKASAWNQRVLYKGTFTIRFKSGYEGVFKRTGAGERVKRMGVSKATGRPVVYYSEKGGVEQLWGPSLQREMQRFPTPEIFDETVRAQLPKRVEHETTRALASLGRRRKAA